jgi:hypothetical protein
MLPLLADITLSLYFGASQTRPSDLHVVQPARSNDATMRAVRWYGFPFRFEIYYGLRLTYTPPYHPWTRIALDYTHFKIYADGSQVTQQDGTWHGSRFTAAAPMQQRVQSFEMTHGLNMLGLSVLQQITGPAGAGMYAGGGPVIYLPHSENRVDGQAGGDGYEYGGSGFQVLAGVRGCLGTRPVFSELKYSRGTPAVTIAQGHAQTRVDAMHELAGTEFRGCRR